MLKMVDGTGIIGVDMICPLGISTPQPPNYDRVELEGTGMLVLPNSLDAPLERLELSGNSEQLVTNGAQLLDRSIITIIASYVSYYAITVGDGKYTLSTKHLDTNQCDLFFFGGKVESGASSSVNGVNSRQSRTVESVDGYVTIGIRKGTKAKNPLDFETMLNFGDKALPYEPYTGGKPSPSPEYPQEIKNSGKWNEETQKYEVDVKVTGKNLLDTYEKAEKDSEFYSVNDDGSLSQLKSDVRPYSDVPSTLFLKSGVYYFSLFNTGVTFKCYNAEADEVFAEIKEPKSILVNLRKDANIKYKVFSNGGSSKNVRVMVSKTKASEYEPYTEQTLTLTSDRPITKWDKLVEQGGEIGWLYQSAINEYRGDTAIAIYETGFYFLLNNKKLKSGEGYCEELKQHVPRDEKPCISFNTSPNTYAYTLNTQAIYGSTVSAIKEYLKTHPLHLVYKTETTEFVPLPQSEQNAIRALKTYYPTTVITVDGGELDPDIKVTYRKEI